MIPQIYITDYVSEAAAQPADMIRALVTQCPALLYATWSVHCLTPLNSLFETLAVGNRVQPYTANPVAALLQAARYSAGQAPAFCLLPVHLGLRRDTYSLQSVVTLTSEVYSTLTQALQRHFAEDFVLLPDETRRYWWVSPKRSLQVAAAWPQDCLYQQAFQWQPQGPDAGVIRQWSNEIQMLLHQLATDSPLESWPMALNSLWFATVGEAPVWQAPVVNYAGQGAVFSGLQALTASAAINTRLAEWLDNSASTPSVWVEDRWQSFDWQQLSHAMTAQSLSTLRLVLPFAERSLEVLYQRPRRWQFWRKPCSQEALLQQLEQSLLSQSHLAQGGV